MVIDFDNLIPLSISSPTQDLCWISIKFPKCKHAAIIGAVIEAFNKLSAVIGAIIGAFNKLVTVIETFNKLGAIFSAIIELAAYYM